MGRTGVRNDTSSPKKPKPRNEKYLKYQKYIRSKQFKQVKAIVFERDGEKCMVCGRTRSDGANLTCHHRTYLHLFQGGEIEANDCICLCQYCHAGVHRVKSNYKWFSMDNPRNNNEENDDE